MTKNVNISTNKIANAPPSGKLILRASHIHKMPTIVEAIAILVDNNVFLL